jgi:hypothetical protein
MSNNRYNDGRRTPTTPESRAAARENKNIVFNRARFKKTMAVLVCGLTIVGFSAGFGAKVAADHISDTMSQTPIEQNMNQRQALENEFPNAGFGTDEKNPTGTYIVQPGDTESGSIADHVQDIMNDAGYKVPTLTNQENPLADTSDVDILNTLNPDIKDWSKIQPGQAIQVPTAGAEEQNSSGQ